MTQTCVPDGNGKYGHAHPEPYRRRDRVAGCLMALLLLALVWALLIGMIAGAIWIVRSLV